MANVQVIQRHAHLAGAVKLEFVNGREGKIAKVVPKVDQVSFSGARAIAQGQHVTYVTERCVMELRPEGLTVTEIAPGIELQRDVLDQASAPLRVADTLREMDARLFRDAPMGLVL